MTMVQPMPPRPRRTTVRRRALRLTSPQMIAATPRGTPMSGINDSPPRTKAAVSIRACPLSGRSDILLGGKRDVDPPVLPALVLDLADLDRADLDSVFDMRA